MRSPRDPNATRGRALAGVILGVALAAALAVLSAEREVDLDPAPVEAAIAAPMEPIPAPVERWPAPEDAPPEPVVSEAAPPETSEPIAAPAPAAPPPERPPDAVADLGEPATDAAEDAVATAEPGPPAPDAAALAVECEPQPGVRIEQLSTTTFAVQRRLVSWYATRPQQLESLGWVRRAKWPDGSAAGFQIGGIECGSVLDLAGLQNGDVVQTVNGKRLRSVPQAVLLYASLARIGVVQLEILRDGEERTLTYRLT